MFIICPKCAAKYKIPEGTSLENGQKLKCSACGHIFTKGEEAPLTLEEPIMANDAFTEPIYTASDLKKEDPHPLPEAFQPVSSESDKKSGLWVIPIYVILLILLCIAGWKFRDLLKPSFSNIFISSAEVSAQKTIIPPKKTKTILSPVQPAEEVQVISKQPIAQKKEDLSATQLVSQPTIEVTSPAPQQPVEITSDQKLIVSEEPEEQIELIPDDIPLLEVVPVENAPVLPKDLNDIEVLPDIESGIELPLFEVIPAKTEPTVQAEVIGFKTELNDSGVLQLLVEGKISNLKAEAQEIPILTLYAYDLTNKLVAQKEIHLTTPMLAPHEILPFYTSLTPVPKGVARIDARF